MIARQLACSSLCGRQPPPVASLLPTPRGTQAGVVAIVTSSTEVEKQEEVLKLAKQFPGQVFCALGVHPDNVKRTNDKQMATWIAQARGRFTARSARSSKTDTLRTHSTPPIRPSPSFFQMKELALSPEAVAIQSGLNLARDTSTHFAQERLLDMHVRLAAEIRLPVILHLAPGSLERAAEIVAAAVAGNAPHPPPQIALANALVAAGDDPASLRPLLDLGAQLMAREGPRLARCCHARRLRFASEQRVVTWRAVVPKNFLTRPACCPAILSRRRSPAPG